MTSGPSGATWSPDGRELIYSMQGLLWRQAVGSGVSAPAHHRTGLRLPARLVSRRALVAYAATRSAPSIFACSISPREKPDPWLPTAPSTWSLVGRPDGRRLAFVSSAFEGRWHIFALEVEPTAFLAPQANHRGSEWLAAALLLRGIRPVPLPNVVAPREELILISNRSHIWGSGVSGACRPPLRCTS